MAVTKSFTAAILCQCGFQNEDALHEYIERLPDHAFPLAGLPSKRVVSAHLRHKITLLEYEGQVVRETKEMTEPGNLVDFMRNEYLSVRFAYLQRRKKLKQQLEKIRAMK